MPWCHRQACTQAYTQKNTSQLYCLLALLFSCTLHPPPILNCLYSNLQCHPSLSFTQYPPPPTDSITNWLSSSCGKARPPLLWASLTTGWRTTRAKSLLLKEISLNAAVVANFYHNQRVFLTWKDKPKDAEGRFRWNIPPKWLWQEFSWVVCSPYQMATGQPHAAPAALCANRKPPAVVLHQHLQLPSCRFRLTNTSPTSWMCEIKNPKAPGYVLSGTPGCSTVDAKFVQIIPPVTCKS